MQARMQCYLDTASAVSTEKVEDGNMVNAVCGCGVVGPACIVSHGGLVDGLCEL